MYKCIYIVSPGNNIGPVQGFLSLSPCCRQTVILDLCEPCSYVRSTYFDAKHEEVMPHKACVCVTYDSDVCSCMRLYFCIQLPKYNPCAYRTLVEPDRCLLQSHVRHVLGPFQQVLVLHMCVWIVSCTRITVCFIFLCGVRVVRLV